LKKKTVANGLREMETEANFSGQADFRTIIQGGKNRSENVDLEERYQGVYQITRKISQKGPYKYERPHLTLRKDGSTTQAYFNGVDNCTIVKYIITMINDGNETLSPIYLKDLFPAGTQFINASLRPSELTSVYAQWELSHLTVGDTASIELMLNATEEADDLVNRVEAQGAYDHKWVNASNFTSITRNWLGCCPLKLMITKTARVDPSNPAVVFFKIRLCNPQNHEMAVRVRDYLPESFTVIRSSLEPAEIEMGKIDWIINSLKPSSVETIEFVARAARDGSYMNRVHAEGSAIDGAGSASANGETPVFIKGTGVKPYTTIYSGWQLPDWGFNTSEEGLGL
jgi:uncharacterized repeat protein (TIGR01451 family)